MFWVLRAERAHPATGDWRLAGGIRILVVMFAEPNLIGTVGGISCIVLMGMWENYRC